MELIMWLVDCWNWLVGRLKELGEVGKEALQCHQQSLMGSSRKKVDRGGPTQDGIERNKIKLGMRLEDICVIFWQRIWLHCACVQKI